MAKQHYRRIALLALPLVVASVVYGQTLAQRQIEQPAQASGYACPLSGEQLPCPKCCPLDQQK